MKHCGQVEKGCECVSGTHQVLCHQSAVALQKEPSSHRAAHTGCKFCKAGFVSLYMITSWLEFPDSTSIRVKVTSLYSLTAVAKCLRHPRLRRDSVSFSSCWPLRMNKDGCKEEICLDHHICPRRYVSPPQLTAIPWAYCFVNIAELYLSASQYFSRVQAFISNKCSRAELWRAELLQSISLCKSHWNERIWENAKQRSIYGVKLR